MWARAWTVGAGWPAAQLVGWQSGSQRSWRGTGEVVEEKNSMRCAVFVKLLRKWCMCMYMCVVWRFGHYSCIFNAMLSLFGVLRPQSLKFQDSDKPLNPVLLEDACEALIFVSCDQVNVVVFEIVDVRMWGVT